MAKKQPKVSKVDQKVKDGSKKFARTEKVDQHNVALQGYGKKGSKRGR